MQEKKLPTESLEKFRRQIDKIDSKLLMNFESRLAILKKMAAFKEKNKTMKLQDKAREAEILSKAKTGFALAIMKKMLKESRKFQKLFLTKKKK